MPTIQETAAKAFFSNPSFAVAGASQDGSKFGYKILAWYHTHSLPVVPINPRAPSITVSGTSYPTSTGPSTLPSPTTTSLSIVTAPPITIKVLQEAKSAGIPSVWLQPGTYDQNVLEYLNKEYPGKWVGGTEGGTQGGEGWCVLVDGENSLDDAGRGWERRKL